MSKILITGGAGFIGSHLAGELLALGHTVGVYDNLRTGKRENLPQQINFFNGDIRDYESLAGVMQDYQIVFHLAAMTSVAESMVNLDECIAINLHGTLNVLKAARRNQIKKVVFASSAAVYGDAPELPKTEAMRLNPKSPYAITKADGEYYCNLATENFGLPTVSTRFFNVFGEKQDPNSSYAAAIPLFISKCIRNQPVSIYGDGTQTRDFIYVKDLIKALVLLMDKATGVFNIGYGRVMNVNTLVMMIQRYLNSNSEIVYIPERPGEIKHSYSSIAKLNALGFYPEFSLEIGLQRTIDYFNLHPGFGNK